MKESKIVIGANFGDEGKGLTTNYFCEDALNRGLKPVVIFHNGTAQRGHTVDYTTKLRHVYHHFGSGTAKGVPTFFAKTFFIHPMTYTKEYYELLEQHLFPLKLKGYVDPEAKVITPFDMLIDHVTENWIAMQHDEREFGSCGFGSWCAIEDRYGDPTMKTHFTVADFASWTEEEYLFHMEEIWRDCLVVLFKRGVRLDKIEAYKEYFDKHSIGRQSLVCNFRSDLLFFLERNEIITFDNLYNKFDSFIFENGQGLGLDFYYDDIWHTTSRTGVTYPFEILGDKKDISVDACYVTRSYVTRHGVGPMEQETKKEEINTEMFDKTNVHNDFQGGLRYGVMKKSDVITRIDNDFEKVKFDTRFSKKIIVTHCNEYAPQIEGDYYSDNPFGIVQRR